MVNNKKHSKTRIGFTACMLFFLLTGCPLEVNMTSNQNSESKGTGSLEDLKPGIPGEGVPGGLSAFPGAEGFGRYTTGGRGGEVVYVTNLNPHGPGSLNEALGYHALENNPMLKPRYILFKVSGIVSRGTYLWDHMTHIEYGDFTLAGHTAPGGIVLGGLMTMKKYKEAYKSKDLHLNNIIIRHIRSRPAGLQNQLDDAIRLNGAQNVIIDHCSFGWADDEVMQIGSNKNFTVQNSIFAETLGDHYDRGGILIKYGGRDYPNTNITFHHNTITRIGGRMPQVEPDPDEEGMGMDIEISNNLLFDPGSTKKRITGTYVTNFSTTYQRNLNFWCRLNLINNYMFTLDVEEKEDYWKSCGSFDMKHQYSQIYSEGNGVNLFPGINDKVRIAQEKVTVLSERLNFPGVTYTASGDLMDSMVENAGAFPRDAMDTRLMNDIENRTISPVPCNEKGADDGHLFSWNTMPIPPLDSDDDGMPDSWELHNGLNPLHKEHNGKELSEKYCGVAGYDNVEVYLNRLSEHYVKGTSLIEGAAFVYPVAVDNVKYNNNLTKGGLLKLDISTGQVNVKTVKVSLTHLENPFAFPSKAPVEVTGQNGQYHFEYTISQDISPGTYQVLIEVENSAGLTGYRLIDVTIL